MDKKHLISTVVILSLIAGLIGGAIGAQIAPKNSLSSMTTTSDGTVQTIVKEPTVVKETLVSNAVTDLVDKVSNSVVSVIVSKELVKYKTNPYDYFMNDPFFDDFFYNDPFGRSPFPTPRRESPEPEVEKEKRQVGGGSGFIISTEGLVMTNKHVVADPEAEYTIVLKDGNEYPATVISRDPSNDLAVLQMNIEDKDSVELKALPLGNIEHVKVGQFVVAIGNALGEFDNTVTLGVVSAKGRKIVASDGSATGVEELSNLLQTDAAINPGNSGGPLLTLEGEVIGVNTAIAQSANNIGFAIPVNEVHAVVNSIKKYGKIVRPFLGVMYRVNTPEVAKQFNLPVDYGAIVQDDIEEGSRSVVKDGPADKAGLMSGDIILELNGEKITEDNGLKDLVVKYAPEEEVTLKVLRGSEEMEIKVTLGKREDETVSQKTEETTETSDTGSKVKGDGYIGITGQAVTKELQEQLGLDTDFGFLLYNDFANGRPAVEKGSPAEKAGLRAGDIITFINGKRVSEENPMEKHLSNYSAGDTITLTIKRNGREEKVELTLGKKEDK